MYEYGVKVRPFQGERVSGDTAIVIEEPDGLFLAIIDVLGHGPAAHEVSVSISEFLNRQNRSDLCRLLADLDQFLRGTRGAAAGLAHLDQASGRLRYAGIGNTVIRKIGPEPSRLVSSDGTLGYISRRPREEDLDVGGQDVILLHTDGIYEHFDLKQYPGIARDSAKAIAQNIVRLFGKPHDDATCIALKYTG
jgi:negative regulator of sigma-B (phosphoserine phosphatase)